MPPKPRRHRFPPQYLHTDPDTMVLDDYIISVTELRDFKPVDDHCPSLVLDILGTQSVLPSTTTLLKDLTSLHSDLEFVQDIIDELVTGISGYVEYFKIYNHLSVPFVSVTHALEMVGVAELDDKEYKDVSTICLEKLEVEVVGGLTRMPCAHVFHKDCVAEWLRRIHMCPLCRFELPPRM